MQPELFWLALTAAFTAVLWIPYVANRSVELGFPGFQWFPPADPPHRAEWANRTARAHSNAVENLPSFAALAIIAAILGGSATTAAACMVYFVARVAHALICIFGMPVLIRAPLFLVSFACQMTLFVTIIWRL